MPKKLTKEIFIERAKKVHGEFYDYSLVEYINSATKVDIICLKEGHGKFGQSPREHMQGQGCPFCSNNNFLKTNEQFMLDAKKIHGDRYDYSLVEYIKTKTKVKIICSEHGEFEQTPDKHLQGRGCPKCVGKNKTTPDFIAEAKMVHGNLYDYSETSYFNARIKIKIGCIKHGIFEQSPHEHLSGCGCPKCTGKYSPTTAEFIIKAKKIHGNLYGYSEVNYINSTIKIEIICPFHGIFKQSPAEHLEGCGCPKCSSKISLPEIIWLNINQIKPKFRQYKLLNYEVDGYDPNTNTVYEFHGDYWHGNPNKFNSHDINKVAKKTYGELYDKTLQREQDIKNAGYNLVVIWESDFKKLYVQQIKNYKSIHGAQKIIECNSY
jgi:hypothetical protein